MKTLDEVIKANECCNHKRRCEGCPYNGIGACALERQTDALHYLKEYQGNLIGKEISEAFDEAFTEIYNPPLTWDELRTMEGRPVWVESQRFGNHWYLNRGIKDESCLYFVGHYGENVLLYDDDMGKVWQAYRKERE